MKEREIVINMERCMDNTAEEARSADVLDDKIGNIRCFKVCVRPMSVDELANGENPVCLSTKANNIGGVSPDSGGKNKERRMSMSGKKPPKPPRPPTALSLDAADQKLIKEISQLIKIKRARIERMKALKKIKSTKESSASTASSGSFIAVLFTIFFCIVIILQGCHHSGILPVNSSATDIPTPPNSNGAKEGNIAAVQEQQNLSTSSVHMLSDVGSSNLMEMVPGSDNKAESGKAIH